jgi:hypothetical protein
MASNDHWTLDLDHLGMKGAGEELARLILTCQPPYAICVQGKWGSGKTSLMRYSMARLGGEPLGTTMKASREPVRELPDWLDGTWKRMNTEASNFIQDAFTPQTEEAEWFLKREPRIVPIWFNPWQHQDAEMPLVALLQELRTQFTFLVQFGLLASKFTQIGVEAGLPILSSLIDTFSLFQGVPKGIGDAGTNAQRSAREHQRRDFEELQDAQRLNLMFEQAVQRLLSSPDSMQEVPLMHKSDGRGIALRRLVIFIDDLDRCSEQQTVRLLEAIKLYLQTRYCVFVVGMDSAAARRAVANVLAHEGEEAQEYLEKLFQATLHVPVPGEYTPFVGRLIEAEGLTENKTGLALAEVASRIVQLVEPNPRKLKNFASTLSVGWSICASCQNSSTSFSLFLLLTFLRSYHPEVYRLLAYDANLVRDLHSALTEGVAKSPPRPSPVYLFFRRTFRHAFQEAFPMDFPYQRKDEDEVVTELIARLDRHKGDRAFLDLWNKEFKDSTVEDVVNLVTKVLRSDQGQGE